jgi:hypothetical protein
MTVEILQFYPMAVQSQITGNSLSGISTPLGSGWTIAKKINKLPSPAQNRAAFDFSAGFSARCRFRAIGLSI